MIKIAISKGHNCSMDIGANGFIFEDKANKEVGNELIVLLNNDGRFKAIDVTPGAASSVSHSLQQRVIKAQNNGCNILIDLHHNAGGGKGTEVYYNNSKAKDLAGDILNKVVELGYRNRGLKTANFYVLKANMPAIVYEGWFVDTKCDVDLYNPRNEARAIYEGILKYYGYSISNNSGNGDVTNNTSGPNERYLNLHPIRSSWYVYPLNVAPVVGNQCAALNPKMYGGLSYKILGNPQKDVYIIETSMFGRVQIYAQADNESSISNIRVY